MKLEFDMDSVQFKALMQSKLGNGVSDEELDELDNWLHECLGRGHIDCALEFATISAELLQTHMRAWPAAYALNTLVLAYALHGDIRNVRVTLGQLVDHSIKHDTPQAGLSGIDNVKNQMAGLAPPDYLMHLCADMVRFYLHFGGIDEAISSLLTVASLLSDYGAFQPAYRALADAEKLSRQHRKAIQLARVLEASMTVAVLEGDLEFANTAKEKTLELYRELEIDPPKSFWLNQATYAMKIGEDSDALESYRHIEQSYPFNPDPHWIALRINMSVCLRRLGDTLSADEQIRKAREEIVHLAPLDREQLIELELVAAANAVAGNRLAELSRCLCDASVYLDQALSTADKLHYRRALRERYIDRLESHLSFLPPTGYAKDVVSIVACTRANQMSDWLHVLEWVDEVSDRITDHEKVEVDQAIDRLANFGAPFLQGYLEKYNDPLSAELMPDPWREFSELAVTLCKSHGIRHPLSAACLANSTGLIEQRLKERYAVLIALTTAYNKAILLIGDAYYICSLPPIEQTGAFARDLKRHRESTISTQEFERTLRGYQLALRTSFDAVLPLLHSDSCNGLIFFPDRLDLLPINLLITGDTRLRARMARGAFDVRTSVALYPGRTVQGPLISPLALVEEPSNLELAKGQFESFCTVLKLEGEVIANALKSDVIASMSSNDALILAQHGVSIGLYADPQFANTRGIGAKGPISFDVIQQSAYRSSYKLVMLSACHSGGLISRNALHDFKSHELAGYPSILLMNRSCVVTGSGWATFDRFDYLLSTRFSIAINEGIDFARAFSIALAAVVDMPAMEAMQLFDYIPDAELRGKMNSGTDAEAMSVANLKSQPFCYGAYQVFTFT